MVATQSSMLKLNTKASPFTLFDTNSGSAVSFSCSTVGKGFLFAFICNHCPFVIHLKRHFPDLFNNLVDQGIKVYAISSNDSIEYPADSPEQMAKEAKESNFNFPYLFDETQQVAQDYKATCTPDFFLFNEHQKLVYRGQYDSSRPGGEIEVSGKDLINAVDRMVAGEKPLANQIPSLGCNIKWKK
mgnify:CR=1 FL=1